MTRTNGDGTPLDVATIAVRRLYRDWRDIEIGRRGDRVTWQAIGPHGGLDETMILTPDAADALANALRWYARQARDWRDARGGDDA